MSSILEKIEAIKTAKENLRQAINNKGAQLNADAKLKDFALAVDGISGGSGGGYTSIDFDGAYGVSPDTRTSLLENIAYYQEVVNNISNGTHTQDDYQTGDLADEFRRKIAWIPPNFSPRNVTGEFKNFIKLREYKSYGVFLNYPNAYFSGCVNLISCTVDFSVITDLPSTFSGCSNLRQFIEDCPKLGSFQYSFSQCRSLEVVDINTKESIVLAAAFNECVNLKRLRLSGTIKTATVPFTGCTALTDVELVVACNLDISPCTALSHKSIAYILSHASGTITLTFSKTAIAGFSESEEVLDGKTYAQIYVEATQKGITIAEK